MNALIILVPLVILLITVFYGVVYTLVRAWMDYRVKLAFLEKLEKKPELMDARDEVQEVLGQTALPARYTARQDYAITGLILAVIGIMFAAMGYYIRIGQFAVGATAGGIICLMLGILIGLIGLVIRFLGKGEKPQVITPA